MLIINLATIFTPQYYEIMNIALLGYGRMGKAIEKEVLARGHQISFCIDLDNHTDRTKLDHHNTDAVIEFTHPDSFEPNLEYVMAKGIPMISGTTGWYEKMDHVKGIVQQANGTFLFSSNFSVGVNMFFMVNQYLAQLMNRFDDYDCFIEEQHHKNKADGPSGTALTLGEQLLANLERKNRIATSELSNRPPLPNELSVGFTRAGNIAGLHQVTYTSEIDDLQLIHRAHNRRGFALGAVLAAEWIKGKTGWFTFSDIFSTLIP